MWFIRVLRSIVFLTSIIFTIPLAFDVGGRTCGLAFSLSLATYYFINSVLRLITSPRSPWFTKALLRLVTWTQWLVVPSLLIWSLNKFSVDADTSTWVSRTFNGFRKDNQSLKEYVFGVDGLLETICIGTWDRILRWSTPLFQLLEGFCSLLVIQAAGQITRWLVNGEMGDTWMIGFLISSAGVLSSSCYFLWRITTFPEIDNVDAILIGATITCAIFLCAWGIGSGRGNPVESSLLFAYVTLCIYQIFTDYRPSNPVEPAQTPAAQPEFPPLPPIIMASYSTLLHALSTLPITVKSAFNFTAAVLMTITPSVLISLAYRLFVFYASARIIPAVRESGARALSQEPSLDDEDGVGQVLGFLTYFSPSILIAVYTSLLMQHFASSNVDSPGEWWTNQGGNTGSNVWKWANLVGTMALYAVELYMGANDDIGGLTRHWKVD